MNTASLTGFSASQKLHPLSLLAQVTSRKTTGCLRVSNGETFWSIYLDQGELIYATNSVDPFERLDRHLRQLSRQIPTIVSAIRVQVRLLFENAQENQLRFSSDYHAICWLVEQNHLTLEQAANLVEEIAKEVIDSFLLLTEGGYGILEKDRFDEWIKICQLDLRLLVDHCQNQPRRYRVPGNTPASPGKPSEPAPKNEPRSPQTLQSLANRSKPNSANPTSQIADSKAKSSPAKLLKEKYTIVCIDDSPTVLQTIKSFLDDISFSVVVINNPVRALMQVVRSKPDLILLDVGMPNLDGYELCSLLRKNQAFKTTPIIMVTGNTGFIDRAKARLAGASGYLTKPFTQPDLLKIVFKHLT